jgi:hypothetical protein
LKSARIAHNPLKCGACPADTIPSVLVMNGKPGAALLDVQLAMATVFAGESVDLLETRLFTENPRAVVKNANGFAFIYPAVVYGIDYDQSVVWEDLDVPGVDAQRCFDLSGRDLDAERDRLRTLLEQRPSP